MNLEEMIKLIQAVSNSSLSKFDLEEGNLKLSMITDKMPAGSPVFTVADTAAANDAVRAMAAGNTAAPAAAPAASVPAASDNGVDGEIPSDRIVKSPLVGTFYNASSPEAEPFAKVGDTVKKGQVLGIIEAMKLMNEIESDFDGVVEAVMVENEQVVEYGQPLFRIR